MSWVAVAVGGAAVVGGVAGGMLSSKGAKSAADTQANAANQAAQLQAQSQANALSFQKQVYQNQLTASAPYQWTGKFALEALLGAPGYLFGGPGGAYGPPPFEGSPGYTAAFDEGMKGIQRAASASGRLGSGAYLKDAATYAKGLASQEYQNYLNNWYQSLNPWLSLAQLGQISTGQTNQAGNVYSQLGSQAYTNQGNALAMGQLGAGQANAAGQLGQYNTLANMANWGGQQLGNIFAGNALNTGYGNMTPYQINSMSWL